MSTYNPQQELFAQDRPVVDVQSVLQWVYIWMGLGLLTTAIVSAVTINTPGLLQVLYSGPWLWVALIAELVLVIALGAALMRLSPGMAALMFLGYAALNGFTLAGIFLVYTQSQITMAFLTTAATFGAMTVIGFTTNMDLSGMRTYLMMGVIGLVVAMVLNIFIGSSGLDLVISLAGVGIFTALTAYDTQRIKRMAVSLSMGADGATTMKMSILGALKLYLDFVNLFLFLLRLFGRRR